MDRYLSLSEVLDRIEYYIVKFPNNDILRYLMNDIEDMESIEYEANN